MNKLRARAVASAVALTLAVAAPPASAQWIVFDPNNYAQSVLTAARELQQINNQIQMLTNQAQSLVNQARNLASLPMSTLTQLQSSIARTQALLGQAQNIAFNVQQIQQAYSTNYGAAAGAGSTSAMLASAQTRWQNSVGAFQDSLKIAGRRRRQHLEQFERDVLARLGEPVGNRRASGRPGRQSAPRPAIPAAFRSRGGAFRQEPRRCAGAGAKRIDGGPGAATVQDLLDAHGLCARQRHHVQRQLRPGSWGARTASALRRSASSSPQSSLR